MPLLRQIVEHCLACQPHEACGLLSGERNLVRRVYPAQNAAADLSNTFRISEREQRKLFETIKATGDALVGIYHSHPDTEAYPSRRDIELAFYDECYYVIVTLARQKPTVRAFRIDRNRFRVWEVPIRTH